MAGLEEVRTPMRVERQLPGLVAVLLCSCGGGLKEASPVPRSVDPSSGFAGVPTPVRITGDGFLARPTGGAIDTRQRAWLDDVELEDVTRVDVNTLTATVPAGLTPGAKTLQVENAYGQRGSLANAFTVVPVPSRLTASLSTARSTAGVGQPIGVTLTLTNGGTSGADVTSVTPTQSGVAAACGSVSPAPPVQLGAGLSQAFTWSCAGSAAGTLALGASAAGTDTTSGAPLSADVTAAQVAVQVPAALAAAVSVDGNPSAVTVGEAFTLRLAASDHGGASATITSLTVTPLEAGCGAPTPGTPRTVAGGGSTTFTFTCAATTAGSLAPAVSVRGQDGNTGGLLTAAATLAPVLTVQPPGSLTAAIAATPTTASVGQNIDVTFYVTNGGGITASVTRMDPGTTGTAAATCTSPTVTPGTTIAPGATLSFGWSCSPTSAGDLFLGGTLTYTAGGPALPIAPAVPLAVTVTP